MPFAYEWGIGYDIARSDFEESSSDEEKEELRRALTGRTEQVSESLRPAQRCGAVSLLSGSGNKRSLLIQSFVVFM